MTEIRREHREAVEVGLQEKIRELDARILALAEQRCQLLEAWYAESQNRGEHFPTLAEYQASQQPPSFAQRLSQFVSGLTYQEAIRPSGVAYLGPEFSYSFAAASKFFGTVEGLQAVQTIRAVFEEIERGNATYGIVPIENSTDGRVVDTLTMFVHKPIKICGEVLLPIHHHLLAKCLKEEIREVHSKPQALSQCRTWLSQHLPGVRWVEVASTAVAAKNAASTPHVAAIASREAGIFLGLDTIAASIEDNPNNVTRFAVIGNERPAISGHDKTTIMFQVAHKPGALADVMVLFRDNGINLTWIESFPVPGIPNEYFFFLEFDGHSDQENIGRALKSLAQTALRLDWLGSYPKAKKG